MICGQLTLQAHRGACITVICGILVEICTRSFFVEWPGITSTSCFSQQATCLQLLHGPVESTAVLLSCLRLSPVDCFGAGFSLLFSTPPHSCLQLRLSHADHYSSKVVLLAPVYRPTQRQPRIAAAHSHAAPAFAFSTCVSRAPLCSSSAVNVAQCCATVLPTGNGYYCHGRAPQWWFE